MKNTSPVAKGRTYEVNIERLGAGGEGVGRVDGFTVFVPGALPGENVRAAIDTVKKSYAKGRLFEVLSPSPERVEPRCPLYGSCGGCQLQHMSYAAQLSAKRRQVTDAVERIGRLKGVTVHETLGADEPWHYRNKMQFPAGRGAKGKVIIGCFAQGSHSIIDTKSCLIQKAANNDILNAMREISGRLGIPPYDEDRHTGALRHVMGRVGQGGETMAVLVTYTDELLREKEIVRMLRARVPHLVSVQQNVQKYHNNVILGRETRLLWGSPTIRDAIGGLSFNVSPRSFFQVNTAQAETLYRKALEYARLSGRETVIDAYSGTGTITLFLAKRARRALGIEIVPQAVRDAKKNAAENRVKNADFIVGDATAVMGRLSKSGAGADVIVLDPPRAGCAPEVLTAAARIRPSRIVYVSCNPATLARDLALLDELGYAAREIQPVDMFPMTSHVETCSKLVRKDLLS